MYKLFYIRIYNVYTVENKSKNRLKRKNSHRIYNINIF